MISSVGAADVAAAKANNGEGTPSVRQAFRQLPPYVAGRRAHSELTAALASNESHYPPLPSVLEAVEHAASQLNRYPDPACTELRNKLATQLGTGAERLVVGAGSAAVLQQILLAVCDPGDDVVYAWRSFEAYPILVKIAGARGVPVPLYDGEHHDLRAMSAAITDRTRVVLLCSPNNPTGVSISAVAFEEFLDRVPPHVLVVLDQAYVEYAGFGRPPLDAMRAFRERRNLVVLRTFSKAYGLAGLRVGYAAVPGPVATAVAAAAVPFAVTDLAQRAALVSLDADRELGNRVAAVAAERERLVAAVRSDGWGVPDSDANFIWLRIADEAQGQLLDAFSAADVLVRAYPSDGVRITLADRATNDRVLQVLSKPPIFERERIQ